MKMLDLAINRKTFENNTTLYEVCLTLLGYGCVAHGYWTQSQHIEAQDILANSYIDAPEGQTVFFPELHKTQESALAAARSGR